MRAMCAACSRATRSRSAIVGDIDAATAGRLIDRTFGGCPPRPTLTPVPDVEAAGAGQPHRDRARRAAGGGHASAPSASPRSDPDFMAAYIVNHILGGGSFTSRLYHEVREKRGLAYGVVTSLVWFDHARHGRRHRDARRRHRRDASSDRGRIPPYGRGRPDRGGARQGQDLSQGLLRARTSTPRARSPRSSCRCRSTISASTISSGASALIDAVTLADAKRVAKRLLDAGCW